jgi:hypothetical protein
MVNKIGFSYRLKPLLGAGEPDWIRTNGLLLRR